MHQDSQPSSPYKDPYRLLPSALPCGRKPCLTCVVKDPLYGKIPLPRLVTQLLPDSQISFVYSQLHYIHE